jgi:hypothetical protein
MSSHAIDYKAEYARRLDAALTKRLPKGGKVSMVQVASAANRSRSTLYAWRAGKQEFSLPELHGLDVALERFGLGGIYGEVTGEPANTWRDERLPLDDLRDARRGEFLRAFLAGADPVETAAKMGLMPHATLLAWIDDQFYSVHQGSATEVDKSVHGKRLGDRADKNYAGLVYAHMKTSLGQPTLYRMKSAMVSYTRLAVPGPDIVLTLPFDPQVPPGFKVR